MEHSVQVFQKKIKTTFINHNATTLRICFQAGYSVRTPGSVNYAIEDGYVPDYHTGRRLSAQSEHVRLISFGYRTELGSWVHYPKEMYVLNFEFSRFFNAMTNLERENSKP